MKSPTEMLIKLLCAGEVVTHDGYDHVLSEDGHLCILVERDGTKVPLSIDCSVKGLISMAESIGHQDLWLRCCALELKRMQ